MNKLIAILLILAGVGVISFGIYKYFDSKKPNAGLKVDATPSATVFVDSVQVGVTPIDKVYKPGEVTIKIIPNSTVSSLGSYQTKVRLYSGVYTVIKRDFGGSEADTGGDIITLEPQPAKTASLSVVVAGPDAASVLFDGQPQGFTPLTVSDIPVGDHQISISAPGFVTRIISAQAVAGYKLTINAKLAGQLPPTPDLTDITLDDSPSTPSASPKPASPSAILAKPYVTILDTPTGFLRVRETASTSAKEMGQVKPGDKYSLLDDRTTGWYRIKVSLAATSSGWISSQYAQAVK